MKKLLLLFLIIPGLARAQKIALLDTKFVKPIIFTDSVTVQQTTTGYFPVGVENFDTLYANLNYIKDMLSKRQRSKMKSFELRAGTTIIDIRRVPFAYGDRYISVAKTKINEVESNFILTGDRISNKTNLYNINKIMGYMKENKELFKSPNEITPKIYNMVIITD